MAKKKKSKDSGSSGGYSVELTGITLILIGIIGFGFGFIGSIIKKFAMFLAGSWWFFVLIAVIILGVYMLYKRKMPKFFNQKLIGLYILIIVILVATHFEFLKVCDNPKDILNVTYNNFMERMSSIPNSSAISTNGSTSIIIGGGIIGALFIFMLAALFGPIGTKIVLVVLLIFGLILGFDINFSELVRKIIDKCISIFKRNSKDPEKTTRSDEPLDEPPYNKEIKEQPVEASEETFDAREKNKVVVMSLDELKKNSIDSSIPEKEEVSTFEEPPFMDASEDIIDVPSLSEKRFDSSSSYRLPTYSEIFNPIKETKVNSNEFTASNKQTLLRVLKDFGVNGAEIKEVHVGPAVTEYELTVPPGTKVSRIVNINKEIALALAAKDVLIQAPIPGKSTIGIEIPNPSIASVTLREVLESPQNQKSDAKLCAALGKDIMGSAKVFDLTKTPHLLVAGSTGSGKSVCVNSIIISLLMRYRPDELKLVLVDPKKVELTNYNGIPHLLCPVVSDPKKASLTLQKVVVEMDQRFQLFSEKVVKNIAGYNDWVDKENKKNPENPISKMPYLVVIIDELADLMLVASKEVEESIARITQLARAAGIHLIVATQRPSTDVVTGLIKNNIPSRIAFSVSSQIDSRTILDQSGAEKLLGRGDMLYLPFGENHPTRVQGCYVSDDEIERLIEFCKNQAATNYDETFENVSQNTSSGSGNSMVDGDDDDAFNDVVDFAIQTGRISASLIQRRFRFGFNRAARMMDLLEARGIVGPQNGSKPREVLIKNDENENEV